MWTLVNLILFLSPGSFLAVITALLGWKAMVDDASPHDFAWTAAYMFLGSGFLALIYGKAISLCMNYLMCPCSFSFIPGFLSFPRREGIMGVEASPPIPF
jgi:hypothetical protein